MLDLTVVPAFNVINNYLQMEIDFNFYATMFPLACDVAR